MTIIIQAPPDVEATLTRAASQEGISVEEYALQAILQKAETQTQEHRAPDPPTSQESLTPVQILFAQWESRPTADPMELARRRRETVELFDKMNRETQAEQPFYARATPDEWMAALTEWANSHDPSLPAFTDEELRRENLYDDRI